MADLEKSVSIIFSGIDKTGAIFSGIGKNLDQFSGKIQDVAQPLATVADGVLKVDAALVAMAAAGLSAAVYEAGKFSDSFKEIETLIDDTGVSVDQFRTDILNYARDSGKSIEDIEAAIYTAISAGTDYKDSLSLLDDSEKLSIATKSGLESSTKLLAGTLNAYGESTDQATKYSDLLFTTVKNGQTTFPELSASLASVLGIAANAGVPFETLAAAIAAVTATGVPTSQAITSIQSAISNIIKPTSQATKLADELGIEFNATALKTKGFEEILRQVQEATGGSADKMAILFGDVSGLSSAMTLGADTSGKFKDSLKAMADSAGATEEAYKKMADGFNDTNQNLANNVKATFIQVGLELQGNYTDIVSNISEVFKSLGVALDNDAFKEIFDALDVFGKDISEFFSELAQSLPEALSGVNWDGFLSALDDLGLSIGSMFDTFDPSDPEDVRDAIQFVVDSLETLIRVSKGMVDSFAPMIEALFNSVDAFNKMDDADKESTGNLLGLAESLVTLGAGFTALMLLIGDNADNIEATFNVVIGSIEAGWGAFKAGLQVISVAVLESIDTILAGIQKVSFGDWEESIKTARAGLQQELDGLYKRLDQSVGEVNSGWDQIVKGVGQGVDQVKKRYEELGKDLGSLDWGEFIDPMPIPIAADKFFDDWDNLKQKTKSEDLDLKAEALLEADTFWVSLARVEAGMRDFEKSGEPIEIVATNFEALETFQQTANAFNVLSFDADGKVRINTNFANVQDEMNAIRDGVGRIAGSSPELSFKTLYKWTDSNGTPHITDTPPDPSEAVGDVEEIKAPIKADVDDKSIKDAQGKIKSAFSKASMGPIDLPFDFGGGGSGMGAVTDGLKDAVLDMEPIDIGEVIDMSGLSDLMDSLAGIENYADRQQMTDEALKIAKAQREVIEAETRNLNTRNAILAQETQNITRMESSFGETKTIKIEASGLEPEMEAFMWKLLKKIQVRANASGAEFLLAAT